MRVPALFHFALGPSIVHPYLIDKLSFYPGGYPARLGGYVSGAVAAETAAPPRDIARFTARRAAVRRGRARHRAVGRRPRHRRRRRALRLHRADRVAPVRQRRLRLRGLSAARRSHARRGARDAAGARIVRSAEHQGREHRRRRAELPPPRPALGTARRGLAAAGADRVRHRRRRSRSSTATRSACAGTASRRGVALSRALRGASLEIGVDAEAQRFDDRHDVRDRPGLPGDADAPMLLADLARTRNALSLRGYVAARRPLQAPDAGARPALRPVLRAGRHARRVRAAAGGAPRGRARAVDRRHRGPLLADAQPARRRRPASRRSACATSACRRRRRRRWASRPACPPSSRCA